MRPPEPTTPRTEFSYDDETLPRFAITPRGEVYHYLRERYPDKDHDFWGDGDSFCGVEVQEVAGLKWGIENVCARCKAAQEPQEGNGA